MTAGHLVFIFQYFLLRFRSKGLVVIAMTLQLLKFIFVNGVVLYGPATMLESSTIWVYFVVLVTTEAS